MTCAHALSTLLEADLSDLELGADTDIGRHLADCDACRRAVALLERGSAELDAWLAAGGGPSSGPDVEAILDAAAPQGALPAVADASRPPPVGAGDAGRDHGPGPGRRGALARARLRWGVPMAAAAVLATLLLVRQPGEPPTLGSVASRPEGGVGLALDVPADRNAAVLHTDNPDITVVWIYGGDR